MAASMGSVIWAAGDKSLMRDYGILMIHNPGLPSSDDEAPSELVLVFTRQIETIYRKRFGLTKDKIRAIMDGEGGELKEKGFSFVNGRWVQKALGKNATDEERRGQYSNRQYIHDTLVRTLSTIRSDMGGSAEMAENIVRKAGFTTGLYSNEPDFKDTDPFNASRITNDPDDDDGGAGGNYSGTGKLSSAAPKQVIVNITNLLSVQTIDLMKSPEGKREEIQNLKEQMAQALIDVVHDFDASWNG